MRARVVTMIFEVMTTRRAAVTIRMAVVTIKIAAVTMKIATVTRARAVMTRKVEPATQPSAAGAITSEPMTTRRAAMTNEITPW